MSDDNLKEQRLRSFDFSDFILRSELEEQGERFCIIPDYQATAKKVKRKRKYKKSKRRAGGSSPEESKTNNLVA